MAIKGLAKLLAEEFDRRVAKNPHYSIRSFARFLEVDSSTLAGALSGKKQLSLKTAHRVIDKMQLPMELKEEVLLGLLNEKPVETTAYHTLDDTTLEIITGWEHYAIMSVLELDNVDKSVQGVAARLNISVATAEMALDRLVSAGFVVGDDDGGFSLVKGDVTTTADIPSEAVQRAHREYIGKALEALESVPTHHRDFSGMTMAVDRCKLEEAKKMITSFRRRLCQFLENPNGSRNEVYRLNIQLFPLTSMRQEPRK